MKITFIGGGNMAQAIIGGLKNNGFDLSFISIIETDAAKCAALTQALNVSASNSYNEIKLADVIVLAVKPQQLKEVCHLLSAKLNQQLVISIAAGVKSATIGTWLNDYQNIVRVMPNTPAQIQAGVSALYAAASVNEVQRAKASAILAAVGKILWLDDEAKMDAVTAISGSGPAYVFYFIEALQEAAIALGLQPKEAQMLALHTFSGAGLMAAQSSDNVKTLRANVTSKGGTTEQGILALEKANIKNTIQLAAKAAADKSRELGANFAH